MKYIVMRLFVKSIEMIFDLWMVLLSNLWTLQKVDAYLALKRSERPNLASIPNEQQYEFTSITRDGKITLAALLLFGIYPQALYPQLSINATCVPVQRWGT